MALRLSFAFGLLAVAGGCSSTATRTAPNDAAMSPDARSDEALDGGGCTSIQASSYDQSCATDTDCTMVGEGQFCPGGCEPCPYAVISLGALTGYNDDVAAAVSGGHSSLSCGVCAPAPFAACCLQGKCHADGQCPSRNPNSAGCAEAGGQCVFGGCSNPATSIDCGSPGAFCCLDHVPDDAVDACPPSGCTGSCLGGAHNVSLVVGACLVWQCCVPDDGGTDAATDGGLLDAGEQ